MSVHIFPDPEALATATANHIADVVAEADRMITLGLAGGGTPAATYQKLAGGSLDWSKVVMWLGDERWVPHDHAESNTRMARETLVDPVLGRFLAPNTAFGAPEDAAADYSQTLNDVFHQGRPDLVLLGIGDDGHTASLFPGTDALEAESGVYLASWVEQKNTWRLTASMPLLWSAREIVFLVQGQSKAQILSQIVDDGDPYPAQRVAQGADNVRWMVDAAAAGRLRSVPR
ncbi:MAG: 6-phosphogluconolactonase [Acidimicrobiia bacterium]|nr:6-phosphogluconolactonase [Acidimicrobiia bacterium]